MLLVKGRGKKREMKCGNGGNICFCAGRRKKSTCRTGFLLDVWTCTRVQARTPQGEMFFLRISSEKRCTGKSTLAMTNSLFCGWLP